MVSSLQFSSTLSLTAMWVLSNVLNGVKFAVFINAFTQCRVVLSDVLNDTCHVLSQFSSTLSLSAVWVSVERGCHVVERVCH